jgi:RNA polymerase sigma-70 factor (ECF subfamily)
MATACESQTSPSLLERLRDPANAQAWIDFVHRYNRRIYGWCRGLGLQPVDAEDVMQEVLRKLFVSMRTFEYDRSLRFRAWLRRVTVNAWKDFVRSSKRRGWIVGNPEIEELIESRVAADDLAKHLREEAERKWLYEAMTRVQKRVQPQTWEAFRLQVFEDYSGAAAAAKLGLSVAAAFQARQRVQLMLRWELRRLEADHSL